MSAITDSTIFGGLFGNSFLYSNENEIKRWHNIAVIKNETVAAHTWDVLKKAWTIGKLLYLCGYNVDLLVMFEMGMIHDIEEKETGDIPSDYKQELESNMKRALEKIALQKACETISTDFFACLSDLLQERRIVYQEQAIIEAQIVRVADCLSAVSFLEKEVERLNNNLVSKEFGKNIEKMIRLAEQYSWFKKIWLLIFGQSLDQFRGMTNERTF